MTLNPKIMAAVEQLDYRVTVGDVAAKAGLELQLAERELLALASDAGGHLQVAETGDIAYLFPPNFRAILRNKYWRIQLEEWWQKIWRVLFYLIRISFGIILILSIILIFTAIFIIITASSKDSNSSGRSSRSSGGSSFSIWYWPDFWYIFNPNYGGYNQRRRERGAAKGGKENELNFFEAIFSFLFGDGNPNEDLDDRRWQMIGTAIKKRGGAVAGEEIAPYLDAPMDDYEGYMLPVLTRFNGRPQVSPDGDIVYQFPELQVTATQEQTFSVAAYLQEIPWRFSLATGGQITLAAGLGGLNLVGALMLGSLLTDKAIVAELGGLVAFVGSIYWLLLAYGVAFLSVPLIRYFWLQWQNSKIESRNQMRQNRATTLNQPDEQLQKKLAYAQQFATANVITGEDLAYSSETDLIEQEIEQSAKIDAEWQRRLEGK
ncbi:hypothetical protein [[Phormidium] sp. ETS-05]|uniref:hypothetical protein n=1 Tax=[Phormidium] sp. ETS-05 TaxID=222819 RepID=UPI0018EED18C|nr:hypothetical protein [[Phormidium] sp. ETS-05]